jgi:selenocysteine lyase/cysteine desulfurase
MSTAMTKANENPRRQPVYLNTAAAGLLSPASVSATTAFQRTMLSNPGQAFTRWLQDGLPALRKKAADLLGTRPSQVAFTPNFSYGLLPVIESIKPQLKKVLLYGEDYPSLNLPFELGGFDLYYVQSPDGFSIPLSDIKETIDREKIEVVAISHVQFLTGFTIDLAELGQYCREKGIVLIVDATQSMGAVDLNFDELPVDVLISSSYKWLNGGYGSAILLAKEEFIARFPPRFAGFGSMDISAEGWTYTPSITSFEPGHLNIPGLLQLEQAIEHRQLDGIRTVQHHNAQLLDKLATGLLDTSFRASGGHRRKDLATLLCFEADKPVHDYLVQKGFVLTWRKGLIRVSPHFYNTGQEIDALLGALKDYGNVLKGYGSI